MYVAPDFYWLDRYIEVVYNYFFHALYKIKIQRVTSYDAVVATQDFASFHPFPAHCRSPMTSVVGRKCISAAELSDNESDTSNEGGECTKSIKQKVMRLSLLVQMSRPAKASAATAKLPGYLSLPLLVARLALYTIALMTDTKLKRLDFFSAASVASISRVRYGRELLIDRFVYFRMSLVYWTSANR